jgi:iron(III) transport system substrate-binding protein
MDFMLLKVGTNFFKSASGLLMMLAATTASAQSPLFDYQGADRMDRIEAAAKKEGTLTLYTTFAEKDQPALIKPFESKYGVKVNIWRAGTDKVLQRTLTEAAARRYEVDVIHFGTPEMEALSREKILQAVASPAHKDLLPGSVAAHREWAATLLSVWVQVYNTNLIKKADLPKTYQDLLDPKWKGKMIWNATSSASAGAGFVGTVLLTMGEEKGMEYLRALAKQNVVSVASSGRQVLDQVISGEYPLGLQIFNNHAVISARQGAPAGWTPLETSMAVIATISVTKGSAHPNAAKLFVDFVTSEEGQKLLAEAGELPVHPNVKPLDPTLRPEEGKFKALFISPEQLEKSMPSWAKTYQDMFR